MIEHPTKSDIAEIRGISKKDFFEKKGYVYSEVEEILRLYKHYQSIINSLTDTHHIVARVTNGSDHPMNRKEMRRGDHVNHNSMFGVSLPHKQILQVTDFNAPVLLPRIIDRIEDILSETQRNKLYKQQAFNS